MEGLGDAALDLGLGSRCEGCRRPGRVLCRSCARLLPQRPRPAWPTPVPDGLAPPWASADYSGLVRALLLAHKERRLLGLRDALGGLLALAVAASVPASCPVLLVPVPSRRGAARARGHDPTRSLVRSAAGQLCGAGYDVVSRPLLRSRGRVRDQAGLGAAERAVNLAGSMWCPARGVRGVAGWRDVVRVVVCDDVLTTGATAREAQRALEAVGLGVAAVATVAATVLRSPVPDPTSGVLLSSVGGTD